MNGDRPKLTLTDEVDRLGLPIFMLNNDYVYIMGPDWTITVPGGYKTNFGSIPRLMRWFVSPVQLGEAAIIHDWLCNEDCILDDGSPPYSGYSRFMADCILFEIMSRMRIGMVKRWGVFLATLFYGIFFAETKVPESLNPLEVEKQ